jgi:hypothetical protein
MSLEVNTQATASERLLDSGQPVLDTWQGKQ